MNGDERAVAFTLNGVAVQSRIRPDQTLLELIRDDFALYGARESCGQGVCGACTVEVDGLTVSSCLYWAVQLEGSQVNTIESPERDDLLDALQQAFVDAGAFQCGFCTPGMIMMCRELLRQNPDPSDEEIRHWLSGSICRCGAYPEILAATRAAAQRRAQAGRLPPAGSRGSSDRPSSLELTMIATTMDALVIHAPNDFSIERVAVPSPSRYEALCRVHAVAICGTDAHIINGDFPGFWPPAMPFTPGHEWAGEIVALGPDAALFGWRVGDRVAGSSHAGCGYCRQCQLGRYQLCDNYGRPDVQSQYGHNKPGAYATYVVQSIKSLTPIPDSMSYDLASMCDTTSIAMHTVNRAGMRPGTSVAVLGAGVMGLLVSECARVVGAARVIVVGRGERLKRAADLGCETVDSGAEDPVAAVRAKTDGLGVEVALECAGSPQTIRWAVDMLRKGGRCAAIGIPLEDVDLPIKKMVLDELEFVGVRANTGEMADVVPLIADGRIRASELITHRFGLREFARAHETFTARLDAALKVIVYPGQA